MNIKQHKKNIAFLSAKISCSMASKQWTFDVVLFFYCCFVFSQWMSSKMHVQFDVKYCAFYWKNVQQLSLLYWQYIMWMAILGNWDLYDFIYIQFIISIQSQSSLWLFAHFIFIIFPLEFDSRFFKYHGLLELFYKISKLNSNENEKKIPM